MLILVLLRKTLLWLWSHKIFQIGKIIFNFPGAPFMAEARRSQFGQFAQRVPSNSPQTDFHFSIYLFPPFSPAGFLFRLLACFLPNFECKSQRKVVKLLKFDFPGISLAESVAHVALIFISLEYEICPEFWFEYILNFGLNTYVIYYTWRTWHQ